ncbi:hypothetical protein V6M85_11195 [Sulfolobus tengchongensis]|uniref:Ubiquitin n=1 Tax=Sulfolobus tengchongensis TaxID=207809 RepID=A0AAX4KZ88_9CREN
MVRIILKGPLVSQFNYKEITINDNNLFNVLSKIDGKKHLILNQHNQIKSGILVLINGKDWRLCDLQKLSDDDVIEIIPVNHGG